MLVIAYHIYHPYISLRHPPTTSYRGRGHAVAFAVSNDCIFLATSRNCLLRHDTTSGLVSELELSKSQDARIRRLFVDPLGIHALVIMQTGSTIDTFFLDRSWKKARPIAKLRNIIVTSVAWPPMQRHSNPTDVLLGTDKGVLYAFHIDDPRKERLVHLYSLHSVQGPIAGLAHVALSSQDQKHASPTRDRIVIVMCGTVLHLFRGKENLERIFSDYDTSSLPCKEPKTFELPIEQGAAQLQLLYPTDALFDHNTMDSSSIDTRTPSLTNMPLPTDFAILSTSGVYYGKLNLDPLLDDELDHLAHHKLLPANLLQSSNLPSERPMSLAVTKHHLVLLYPSRVQFVNRLTKRSVQEIPLTLFATPMRGAAALPLGLCRDILAGRILVLAGDDAFEVDTSDEDRDLWKILLERGDYRAALMQCRSADQRNAVYLAEGNSLFQDGETVHAAEAYGKMTSASPSFEELALKFMERGDSDALLAFLMARLSTLGKVDRAQSTMLSTWLLELLLDKANRAALLRSESDHVAEQCQRADKEVEMFLMDKVDVLDAGTTLSLLEGYGRHGDLLTFVRARGDHEATLERLVQGGEAERALEVLRKPSVSPELVYKYASTLLALAPAQTVQSWIEASALEPRRLLPALMPLTEPTSPPAARGEALRYIRHCILTLHSVDPSIHDFAVALLTVDKENEGVLLEHLATARDARGRPLYDVVHALRLARECRRDRATVALLSEAGLWEDAVRLALTIDQQLAEETARRGGDHGDGDAALSRVLWLIIARHVVGKGLSPDEDEKKQQVREMSRILDESRGAVRIDDILPMFPDFVEMGAFRDAICASLERYNEEMESLRSEMALATKTAAALRESLEKLDGRGGTVDMEEPCARCKKPLHQQPPALAGPSGGALPRLFLFPTGNAFHGSCLCAEAAELAPSVQKERILSLAKRLASLPEGATSAPATQEEPVVSVAELRKQLEDEVASEDPYCGEIVVRHISKPFILPEEEDVAASWAL